MKKFIRSALLSIGLLSISTLSFAAADLFGPRLEAETFASLPVGAGNPEALAVDDQGNVYVSTFSGGNVFIFDNTGFLTTTLDVTPTSGVLLELAFHPVTGALLVVDFGLASILEVDTVTGAATIYASIPVLPGNGQAVPNGLTFDATGNLYITDSFQSTVWKVGPEGGVAEPWITDPLLGTTSPIPFAANGLAFNNDFSSMFVSNSGSGSIINIPVNADGTAGVASTFLVALNGPDGMIMDQDNNIWVANNPSNEIMVIDPTGKATQLLGEFHGLDAQGRVKGLLSPADLNFHGDYLYVTNFAADPRELGINQMPFTLWSVQVQQHTIARFNLNPPKLKKKKLKKKKKWKKGL
ncbi:MAG TPA: gluconolaconase [Gammaproteobacteria bacterium]|nr:gluconolaconase [Gammaproteobacteria bacterium]